MNEFKRPVKISLIKISETMYILKQVLHYGKNELNKLIEITGLSVYSGYFSAISDWVCLWWVFHSNKNAVSDIRLNVVGDLKKLYKSLYMRQSP